MKRTPPLLILIPFFLFIIVQFKQYVVYFGDEGISVDYYLGGHLGLVNSKLVGDNGDPIIYQTPQERFFFLDLKFLVWEKLESTK